MSAIASSKTPLARVAREELRLALFFEHETSLKWGILSEPKERETTDGTASALRSDTAVPAPNHPGRNRLS